MNQNGFFKICKLNDLKEKEGKRFLVEDVEIALFKVKDKIYAYRRRSHCMPDAWLGI